MIEFSPTEVLGCLTGVSGAAALAIGFPFIGFCLFAVSNVSWLLFARKKRHVFLGLMNVAYSVTTVVGLLHWS